MSRDPVGNRRTPISISIASAADTRAARLEFSNKCFARRKSAKSVTESFDRTDLDYNLTQF